VAASSSASTRYKSICAYLNSRQCKLGIELYILFLARVSRSGPSGLRAKLGISNARLGRDGVYPEGLGWDRGSLPGGPSFGGRRSRREGNRFRRSGEVVPACVSSNQSLPTVGAGVRGACALAANGVNYKRMGLI